MELEHGLMISERFHYGWKDSEDGHNMRQRLLTDFMTVIENYDFQN